MRCLYCGKELALLKRWTGGGEFCSDAHRQQYQDEYNQLALGRLQQAKPPAPAEPAPIAEPKQGPVPLPQAAPSAPPESASRRARRSEKQTGAASQQTHTVSDAPPRIDPPQPAPREPIAEPEPIVAFEPEPVVAFEPGPEPGEELAPADLAGFFIELPVPVLAEVMAMTRRDAAFESDGAPPALPPHPFDPRETQLVAAGPLELAAFTRIMDWAPRSCDRKLDARDFGRTAPLVEVDLGAAGETELPEAIEEPMDILIFPHPPQDAPPLWEEPWLKFALEENLGALARVAFRTTGVRDNEDASDPIETLSEVLPAPAPLLQTEPAAPQPAPLKEGPGPVVAKEALPVREPEIAKSFATPVAPAPPAAPKTTAPAAPKPIEQMPPLVTKPLPVTVHGLAAGRGKPVQIFAAVTAGADLQIPRSSALPLRPVMTLGLALGGAAMTARPPEKSAVVNLDSRKNPPPRPDPRLAGGKGRKNAHAAEVANEPERKEPDRRPAAVAPAKPAPVKPMENPAGTVAANPAERPIAKAPEKLPDSSRPAPMADPGHPHGLDVPRLSLEPSGGFWKRLPLAGKAGLALTMVALAMAIVFTMKTGTSVAAGPRVVEAPAITGAEGGWITDWGVEPGVRKLRDISVLRASLNMNDYRIEFEAQIELKALGWIYRGADAKNYGVCKLEIVKPGLTPTVALVRYLVIDGEEQAHSQFPLNMAVRLDTTYKIRFDAIGNHFTTWVQDQNVDDWTDARLKKGGVGLYSDRGESMSLKKGTLRVAPLVIRN